MPKTTNNQSLTTDVVIVGAGVVGLAIARQLMIQNPQLKITVLEKEPKLACHASGRNSGVLHAGIYYAPGSLKATLCVEGARMLRAYCEENRLPLNVCGKLIVPASEAQAPEFEKLFLRAQQNSVRIERIDERALKRMEPEVRSATGEALFSPETAAFDPKAVLDCLAQEIRKKGVTLLLSQPVRHIDPEKRWLQTPEYKISYGMLINTAGLHADRIAKACGVGERYAMLPFKGMYYTLSDALPFRLHHHVYPVPDPEMPFLGVHFTCTVDGHVTVGPTAYPALGRENYEGFSGVDWAELPAIVGRLGEQWLLNQNGFRRYTQEEGMRFYKPLFAKAAQMLVPGVQARHLVSAGKVGIRAQLLDRQTHRLVMDFVVEKGPASLHVLNAVSPAFTSALAFARHVCESQL